MPNQLAVQPTQRKVSGMSNWFILQPNVVLYKVHTWELHYQVSKYESWFYTRMLSWGEWDLWATWFPQCLAVLTIYHVPGHQQGGKKRGLSSLNIIHWQKKSDLSPGFSQTPHTPDIPAASTSVLRAVGSDFHLELGSAHSCPLTVADRGSTIWKLAVLSEQSMYRVARQSHYNSEL